MLCQDGVLGELTRSCSRTGEVSQNRAQSALHPLHPGARALPVSVRHPTLGMAFLLPPPAASVTAAALPSVTRHQDVAVSARRRARIGSGVCMSSDSAGAATAAGRSGEDPPLAPVPSRAGRVKVRRGWSNTTGELIRRVCDDVWVVERACTLGGGC